MNNYEFGKMIYSLCNVAQVRLKVLASVESGDTPCDAENGFVGNIRDRTCHCKTEEVFLKAFDKANQSLKRLS